MKNKLFEQDYYRMTGKKWSLTSVFDLLFRYDLRYLKHIRNHRGGGTHAALLEI